MAFVWPHWLQWLSWNWINPTAYNFWSSSWGAIIEKVLSWGAVGLFLYFKVWRNRIHKHLECHMDGCDSWGHPVPGTAYRACHPHNPAVVHGDGEPVTALHLDRAYTLASTGRPLNMGDDLDGT